MRGAGAASTYLVAVDSPAPGPADKRPDRTLAPPNEAELLMPDARFPVPTISSILALALAIVLALALTECYCKTPEDRL